MERHTSIIYLTVLPTKYYALHCSDNRRRAEDEEGERTKKHCKEEKTPNGLHRGEHNEPREKNENPERAIWTLQIRSPCKF